MNRSEEHEFAIICIAIVAISVVGVVWWVGPSHSLYYSGTIEKISSKYTSTGIICTGGKTTTCIPYTNYWTDMMVLYNKTRTEWFHESGWQWKENTPVCITWTYYQHGINQERLSPGAC